MCGHSTATSRRQRNTTKGRRSWLPTATQRDAMRCNTMRYAGQGPANLKRRVLTLRCGFISVYEVTCSTNTTRTKRNAAPLSHRAIQLFRHVASSQVCTSKQHVDTQTQRTSTLRCIKFLSGKVISLNYRSFSNDNNQFTWYYHRPVCIYVLCCDGTVLSLPVTPRIGRLHP